MTDPTADLRAEIVRLGPWHHDIEVVPGVRTARDAHGNSVSVIRPDLIFPFFMSEVYPDGLGGRSVLDCACNGGGYLFAAKDIGAGRAAGFDVREHWIRQAELVESHRKAGVELEQCDLRDLKTGKFDITLFMGILYHLPDPVAALKIAADHTNELLVVNTAVSRAADVDGLVLSLESDTEVMSGVHKLAWMPTNARVVQEMLAWCGFPHTRVQFDRPKRMQVLAARDEGVFRHYDAARASVYGKVRVQWQRWNRWRTLKNS